MSMALGATSLIAAAALFSSDLPHAVRLKKLSNYFSPSPRAAKNLVLDSREIRELRAKKPESLRGYIWVRPPKGHCFTIQLSDMRDDQPDQIVCKPTQLAFQLGELDRQGRLHWQVKTGDGDFGTELIWQTPYRIAQVTPYGKTKADPPQYLFIQSCEAKSSPSTGRKIVLHLFGGETWTILFPEKDELMVQPPPISNLTAISSGAKRSVKDASEEADRPPEHGASTEAKAAPSEPKTAHYDEETDRTEWGLPTRDSYEMSASNFQPNGSVTPGLPGRCRYRFEGPPEEPKVGRIECHETDLYHFAYAPLTCLSDLKR